MSNYAVGSVNSIDREIEKYVSLYNSSNDAGHKIDIQKTIERLERQREKLCDVSGKAQAKLNDAGISNTAVIPNKADYVLSQITDEDINNYNARRYREYLEEIERNKSGWEKFEDRLSGMSYGIVGGFVTLGGYATELIGAIFNNPSLTYSNYMEAYRDLFKFTYGMSEEDFYSENFIKGTEDGFILDALGTFYLASQDYSRVFTSNKHTSSTINNDIVSKPNVGSALHTDSYHRFPNIVDNYAGDATRFEIPNGTLYQIQGSFNGYNGRFEWIIQDNQVTHRLFVRNGTINGIPSRP